MFLTNLIMPMGPDNQESCEQISLDWETNRLDLQIQPFTLLVRLGSPCSLVYQICCIFRTKYLNNDFLVLISCVAHYVPRRTRKKNTFGRILGRTSLTITLPPLGVVTHIQEHNLIKELEVEKLLGQLHKLSITIATFTMQIYFVK